MFKKSLSSGPGTEVSVDAECAVDETVLWAIDSLQTAKDGLQGAEHVGRVNEKLDGQCCRGGREQSSSGRGASWPTCRVMPESARQSRGPDRRFRGFRGDIRGLFLCSSLSLSNALYER